MMSRAGLLANITKGKKKECPAHSIDKIKSKRDTVRSKFLGARMSFHRIDVVPGVGSS
jgi:hypothetical protein